MSRMTILGNVRSLVQAVGVVTVLAVLLAFGGSRCVFADDHGGGGSSGGSGSGSSGGGKDDGGGMSGGNSGGSGSPSSGGSGSVSSSSGSGGSNRMESESHEVFENFGARLRVRVEARDDRFRFKVEVENLNLAAGTMVNVCVQGQSVGMMALDALHGAELQLESRGSASALPVGADSLVEVRVGACASSVPAILSARVGGSAPVMTAAPARRVEDRARAFFQGFGAELQVEVENERDRNRLRVEVENVNLTPGAMLNVCLRGDNVGRITLDDFHSGELEFDSRRDNSIPSVSVGDLVEVREGACLLAGAPLVAVRVGRGAAPANNGAALMTRLDGTAQAFFAGFAAELNARFEAVGNRQRFRVEVENLNLPAGTVLNVCRQGQLLGTIMLNQFHTAELELNSRDGMAVPAVAAGDMISVRQGGCGSASASIIEAMVR